MKVVHIPPGVTPVPPGDIPDGTESYVFQLTKHLAERIEVSVIDVQGWAPQKWARMKSKATFYLFSGLPYPWTFLRRIRPAFIGGLLRYVLFMSHVYYFTIRSGLQLVKLNSLIRPDIVHAHSREVAVTATIVKLLTRSHYKIIYNTHTSLLFEDLTWKKRVVNFLEFLALKTEFVVASTSAVRDKLVRDFSRDPSKTFVINNSSAFSDDEVGAPMPKSRSRNPVLLCVGTITDRKNQLTAIRSMPEILVENPDVQFIFAGPFAQDGYFNGINRMIEEDGLDGKVILVGPVSRNVLREFYRRASVFVFPTRTEAQGIVVIEAMKFGLPIVASNIPPISEIANNCPGSIVLVNPESPKEIAHAVNRILRNDNLFNSMSADAIRGAESYSWKSISSVAEGIYQKVLNK